MTILKATRRDLLKGAAAASLAGAFPMPAIAQGAPLKIGFMLPYTGTFAKLGKFIDDAFRLNVELAGGKLGGRAVEYVQVDDESEPAKATDNMNRLVGRDKVDVVVGTVHSGVAMAMAKVAKDSSTLLVVPNAGANEVTGPMCAPNIWRTSFTNWQPCYPMGKVMYDAGHRNVMTITWRYAAGQQMVDAFKENFLKLGGKVTDELYLPFPQVEFQALLTQIAQKKPDAVFSFFAGGGAVKFVKDYAAAGLRTSIPLYGAGFLTDGTLQAQGADAEGIKTTLHYADDLDNPANKKFLAAFKQKTGQDGDVYAVQGFDAAALLNVGLTATKGDFAAKDAMYAAMRAAKIDSPRGPISFSKANNVVQNIYLREVKGGLNRYVSVAHANLADPALGCRVAS
jgi:branched-chain amino acid transport system substrate-binding protein